MDKLFFHKSEIDRNGYQAIIIPLDNFETVYDKYRKEYCYNGDELIITNEHKKDTHAIHIRHWNNGFSHNEYLVVIASGTVDTENEFKKVLDNYGFKPTDNETCYLYPKITEVQE